MTCETKQAIEPASKSAESCRRPKRRSWVTPTLLFEVSFRFFPAGAGQSASVKSFGRRQAYESPRRTNPRTTCAALWGFCDLPGRAAEPIVLEACRRRCGRAAVMRFSVY